MIIKNSPCIWPRSFSRWAGEQVPHPQPIYISPLQRRPSYLSWTAGGCCPLMPFTQMLANITLSLRTTKCPSCLFGSYKIFHQLVLTQTLSLPRPGLQHHGRWQKVERASRSFGLNCIWLCMPMYVVPARFKLWWRHALTVTFRVVCGWGWVELNVHKLAFDGNIPLVPRSSKELEGWSKHDVVVNITFISLYLRILFQKRTKQYISFDGWKRLSIVFNSGYLYNA